MDGQKAIRYLLQAVEAAPDNVELRRHLSEALLGSGKPAEAEQHLREALRQAPRDPKIKLLLARAYRKQNKTSEAFVILEDMIRNDVENARAHMEHAHLMAQCDDLAGATREFQKARKEDPEIEDDGLAALLGIQEERSPDSEVVDGRIRMPQETSRELPSPEPIRSEVNFSDVGGMEELKADIRRKIIHPMEHPELYKAYGKKAGGGILLYGPPGCGKTHIARATAGEIQATFLSVGIHDVLDMWVGQSEHNLHQVFEQARRHAPCVLFFDEADALGSNRGDMKSNGGRQIINQFLAELDGVQSANDGVLVLAATNAPWQMDAAFRRPGRFDRLVFVPPPDLVAREEILRILLRGKPQMRLDLTSIAKRTKHFSGADLSALVDVAVDAKLEEAVSKGNLQPLATRDLVKASKSRKATTREWFRTVRNYIVYANEDGQYDDVRPYLDL